MTGTSEAEQQFCVQSVHNSLRLDGRALNDYRPIELELGLIAQASGSARLHLGATDVVVGVKVWYHVNMSTWFRQACARHVVF